MTDELKPSPEAVRDNSSDLAHIRGDLVIDRALRPATMPGDVVEAIVAKWLPDFATQSLEARQVSLRAAVQEGITAMQPAIQAAVEALDAVEAAQINPTYGWNITALNKARPLVASALATLRQGKSS